VIILKLYLYENKADKRYLSKTTGNNYLIPLYNDGESSDGAVECAIIDDTSVINPTFKISRKHYWKRCNYAWSEDTLRYYYVTDVTMSQNYVLLTCHVDVLNTFKLTLADKNVIIKRASKWDYYRNTPFNYNKYLNDDKFKAYSAEMNRSIAFPNNGTNDVFRLSQAQFVMCVVGNTSNPFDPEPEGGE
jgi:hypothetical protein